MASVGHGLAGLTLSGMMPTRRIPPGRSCLLPGFMVLLAYAVDVVEWYVVALGPDGNYGHFMSHSPWAVAGIVLLSAGAFAAVFRSKNPWAYVLVAAAILSHIAMDEHAVRIWLMELYTGRSLKGLSVSHVQALPAEIWFYGLPLVLVLLIRGGFARGAPRRGTWAAGILGFLCIVSAWARHPAVWGPFYALGLVYALVLLRRHFARRVLWSLALLAPIAPLVVSEIWVTQQKRTALRLYGQGRHAEALDVYLHILRQPSRINEASTWYRIGNCHEQLGNLEEAERSYRKSMELQREPGWAELTLARFYRTHKNTSFHRPAEARRLYERLLSSPDAAAPIRARAKSGLESLEQPEGASAKP